MTSKYHNTALNQDMFHFWIKSMCQVKQGIDKWGEVWTTSQPAIESLYIYANIAKWTQVSSNSGQTPQLLSQQIQQCHHSVI